jgi:ABC-type bacteriocin/lantibiotic exporter with double-glycine peptidase domain
MSVMENIQYGNNMSPDEIKDMCEKLNISNIFKNLKDGYDTNAGIDGNNLSGGQRQIIHILRCIFKKNKIVILDEPTSAIDKENTEVIINIIKELSKNSTLILITHDESILYIVDRVITLDSGKIINDVYQK